jgi:hypothetical protein
MKKKYLFLFSIALISMYFIGYKYVNYKYILSNKEKHAQFLKNSPFSKTKLLSKKERKSLGIPPNKYMERQWELTMNPDIGKPTPENLPDIINDIKNNRYTTLNSLTRSVPGDSENFWEERGPNNVGGRVKAVLFDPNDNSGETVFAGGVSGGLWKNTNISSNDSNWALIPDTANLSVTSLSVDPNDSNTFYLGTGESYTGGDAVGNGVWKSVDGGNTWTNIFGGINGEVTYLVDANMVVNTPSSIAGEYNAIEASSDFSPSFTNVTGDLVLVDDGTATPNLACEDITNGSEVNGNIAVIIRGECNFDDKIHRAQDVGAIAVIMINNVAGEPIVMGGDDTAISIPSVMISQADGDILLNEMSSNTVNVTLNSFETPISGAYLIPGASHINDVLAVNNGGNTDIYVTVGDSFYSDASTAQMFGSDSIGIYKSADGGNTWNALTMPETPDGNQYVPFDLEASSDGTVWFTTTNSAWNGAGGGAIFNTLDGINVNLKHTIPDGLRVELAASKNNPNKFYVLSRINSTTTPVKIFKTISGFTSVDEMTLPEDGSPSVSNNDFTNGQSFYNLAIEVDPNNDETVYVGGIGWFKSVNGAITWSQVATGYTGGDGILIHPDQHGITFFDSNKILMGNDGGVVYSSNAANSMGHRINNLNVTQFYDMSVAPTGAFSGAEYLIAGSQDNGTQKIENAASGINNSILAQGGDGASSFFDQDGSERLHISNYVYNQNIRLYNYDLNNTITINSESSQNGDFINQEAFDSNLNILFSNYSNSSSSTYAIRRYKITSMVGIGTVQKATLTNVNLDASPTALKVSPYTTETTTLFVGLENGKILRLTGAQGFTTWTDISPSSLLGSISDIEFGASEDEIFVTVFNYGVSSIWYTSDGGSTWEEKEGDLPDFPVLCILQNPLRPEQVLIGTELGTWWTDDFTESNPNWYTSYHGMGPVKITDLEMRDDYKVYAATYGRGIFSGQFTSDDGTVGIDDNFISSTSIYPNPTLDILNVRFESNMSNPTFKIYNIEGKLLSMTRKNENNYLFSIDVSDLSVGSHILNINVNGKSNSIKFIKQ